MKINHIDTTRQIGGDYFQLIFRRICNITLGEQLTKFNHKDYHIIKTTNKQRVVTYEEMIKFTYSGYTLYRKDLYDADMILQWCDKFMFKFLVKPTPPFNPNKINVR
jgi:hypothetical protein